jgi:hypothetical protein
MTENVETEVALPVEMADTEIGVTADSDLLVPDVAKGKQ